MTTLVTIGLVVIAVGIAFFIAAWLHSPTEASQRARHRARRKQGLWTPGARDLLDPQDAREDEWEDLR